MITLHVIVSNTITVKVITEGEGGKKLAKNVLRNMRTVPSYSSRLYVLILRDNTLIRIVAAQIMFIS